MGNDSIKAIVSNRRRFARVIKCVPLITYGDRIINESGASANICDLPGLYEEQRWRCQARWEEQRRLFWTELMLPTPS